MEYQAIAVQIIALKNADLEHREKLIKNGTLSDGYDPTMEAIHNINAKELDKIINAIGFPTPQKVGAEASEAAWLIIQHAISQPQFMVKCTGLLKDWEDIDVANKMRLAYLQDRIAVFQGAPQLYGTQFDWDEHGELSPQEYDNITLVNKRRKAVGLPTLEEQTIIIRNQAIEENQTAPLDLEERNSAMLIWKKKVGWMK